MANKIAIKKMVEKAGIEVVMAFHNYYYLQQPRTDIISNAQGFYDGCFSCYDLLFAKTGKAQAILELLASGLLPEDELEDFKRYLDIIYAEVL